MNGAFLAEGRARKRETSEAAAALDALCAARPLKPPPFRFAGSTRTASRLALEADRRLGIIGTTAFPLGVKR